MTRVTFPAVALYLNLCWCKIRLYKLHILVAFQGKAKMLEVCDWTVTSAYCCTENVFSYTAMPRVGIYVYGRLDSKCYFQELIQKILQSFILKIEVGLSSEMSVYLHQRAWHHVCEDGGLQCFRRENVRSFIT